MIKRRSFLAGVASFGLAPAGCSGGSELDHNATALDLETLVSTIVSTPTSDVLAMGASQIQAGLTLVSLQRGIALAAARHIVPGWNTQVHGLLQVHSLARLSQQSPRGEDIGAALISLYQARSAMDDQGHDWTSTAPIRPNTDPWAAFSEAMAGGQAATAEAVGAVFELLERGGPAAVREAVWPHAARNVFGLGHSAIGPGELFDALDLLGWTGMQGVVGAAVELLLNETHEDDLPGRTESPFIWAESFELSVRDDWQDGEPDDDARDALRRALRDARASRAMEHVAEALDGGLAPSSVWEAAAMLACEAALDKDGVFIGAHAITSLRSLYQGYRTVFQPSTRLHLTLMSGAWVVMLREELRLRMGKSWSVDLDDFGPVDGRLDEALAESGGIFTGSGDSALAAGIALNYLQQGGSVVEYSELLRRYALERSLDEHPFKVQVAAFDLAESFSPSAAELLRATAIVAHEGSTQGVTQEWSEILDLLSQMS